LFFNKLVGKSIEAKMRLASIPSLRPERLSTRKKPGYQYQRATV
jgi:hypothetical protein